MVVLIMPVRGVEESRQTALRALEDAKRFQVQGVTHPKFCGLKLEDQQKLFDKVYAVRSAVIGSEMSALGIDRDISRFNETVKWSRGTGGGNCAENASLALDYVANNEPEAFAEIYQLDPAVDHVFCVIDRKKDSDPNKPETWGENAFVCDPWADQVYSASALTEKKSYIFTDIKERPNKEGGVKEREVIFDPSLHKIEPQKKLDTDTIRATKSKDSVDHVLNAFQKKSEIVLSALDTLSKDLEKEAKRLDKDKSSISTEKGNVIKEKMTAVQNEITRIKDDVKENIPNRDDYVAARAQLENKLQTTILNTSKLMQLDAAQEKILNKQKNPMLDKLMGKTAPQSAVAMQQAIEKARNTLNTLNNQVSPQIATNSAPLPANPDAPKPESQPELKVGPQAVSATSVPERNTAPASQPNPNLPGSAAAAPIPAAQSSANREEVSKPIAEPAPVNVPKDADPAPVEMSSLPDSASNEEIQDASANETASADEPSKAPTPKPSHKDAEKDSADKKLSTDEMLANAPKTPNNEPGKESPAPESTSGDDYQFPDTPTNEPGEMSSAPEPASVDDYQFPDTPTNEPGEGSGTSNEETEKESTRNDPIPS